MPAGVTSFFCNNTHVCEGGNNPGNPAPLTSEWVPSKGRSLHALTITAAAQSQPSGKALPQPVPNGHPSTEVHIQAACAADPFLDPLLAALPVKFTNVANACVRQPASVVAKRARALRYLRQVNAQLDAQMSAMAECMPVDSPVRAINFPLIYFLTSTLMCEDSQFFHDLLRGMPIVGSSPATNVLEPRVRGAVVSFEQWRGGIPVTNAGVVERLHRSAGSDLARECWEKTLSEVEAVWVSVHRPLTEGIMRPIPLTPRFAEVIADGKLRLIDDFRASGINDLLDVVETDVPQGLDAMLAMTTYYQSINPRAKTELRAFSVDFKRSYKQAPLPADQAEFAHVALAAPDGPIMVAELRTQPFGSPRAPANWGRATAFAQWVLASLFDVYLAKYVDDCYSVEPSLTAFFCHVHRQGCVCPSWSSVSTGKGVVTFTVDRFAGCFH